MLEPPECSVRLPRRLSWAGLLAPTATADGRLLVIGARRRIQPLSRWLEGQGASARLPIVGFVDHSGRGRQLVVHPGTAPVPVLGPIDRLDEVVDRSGATDVVVALSGPRAERIVSKLEGLSRGGDSVRVHWVPEASARPDAGVPARPITRSAPAPWPLRLQRLAKRGLDIVGALIGLLVLAPLFLGIAAAILATDGGPIFYSQERVGRGGRIFRIWKFRSMRRDAEADTGPIWAENHDRRCTRIGDWLRHTNLDELPQLYNVLKGDMALVGPRPERPVFVERFQAEHADYDLRHAVPVGMTGWAQVHGWRGRTSLRKRIQYDLDYIQRWSFGLDLRVLVMTVEHVLRGRTSWGPMRPMRRVEP